MNYFYDLPYEIQELIYKKVYFGLIKDIVNHPLVYWVNISCDCDYCFKNLDIYDKCAICGCVSCDECKYNGCSCNELLLQNKKLQLFHNPTDWKNGISVFDSDDNSFTLVPIIDFINNYIN